jgi:phage tail sheath protein FI
MPTAVTYPGVYIEEVPSGVHPITGVATAITAFVGFAKKGLVDTPTIVHSFAEFDRTFGGLWDESTMSYAAQQYFMNGGRDALIVRAARAGSAKKATDAAGPGALGLEAASEGEWGNRLRVRIDTKVDPAKSGAFNLSVKDLDTQVVEVFRNLSVKSTDPLYAKRVLEQGSKLLRFTTVPGATPTANVDAPKTAADPFEHSSSTALGGGSDGLREDKDLVPSLGAKSGLYALDRADLFNLLCIPATLRNTVLEPKAREDASNYCSRHRALFITDPDPGWADGAAAVAAMSAGFTSNMNKRNAAIYFPALRATDPLRNGSVQTFAPCGAVAGIMARTDAERGVWKAPAGLEAGIAGASELTVKLTNEENGDLNPLGVNCLRTFPVSGNVVWGARTLAGADVLASEWKYVSVRRTALFLEESLYRGTQWVVFEPNDEPLWAQIRLNVGSFMHNLFRQGAFQGKTPRVAYLVKCDGETTTQDDINLGVVNILVGFAPLRPAEFVIVKIQQMAGQTAA